MKIPIKDEEKNCVLGCPKKRKDVAAEMKIITVATRRTSLLK
jgi:hypothetical protein